MGEWTPGAAPAVWAARPLWGRMGRLGCMCRTVSRRVVNRNSHFAMIPYDHFASRPDTPHRLQLPAAGTARFRQRDPDVPPTDRLVPAGHPRPPPETRPATALHPTAGAGTGRIPHPGVGCLRAIACGRVPRD